MTTDQIKRQADADAIRHAAKLIEAVTIEAQSFAGHAVSDWLCRHKENLVRGLNDQALIIERAQS